MYTVIKKEIGSSIGNLYCSADCNPGCNYTWTTDINNVTRNGHVLALGIATFDKDGTYFCTAVNGFGSSRKVSAKLVIEGIPLNTVTVTTVSRLVFAVPIFREIRQVTVFAVLKFRAIKYVKRKATLFDNVWFISMLPTGC